MATAIFLPLVAVAIMVGIYLPLDLSGLSANPQRLWGYLLLAYCFVAAMAPVWALLQPRGNLGGYFLYVVMVAAVLGIVAGACTGANVIRQPFFAGWTAPAHLGAFPLFPMLFITVACGACSGFHGVVAGGTSSKQLDCERDALVVGYGGMLLEGLFACISLSTVMIAAAAAAKPDAIYAAGIAGYARQILAPVWKVHGELGKEACYCVLYQFALLCFATFVFDTLDACTRLARYVLMEMFGWKTRMQSAAATALTLALPAVVLLLPPVLVQGKPQPLWQAFWGIFGSSNQLLAALTLLAVTVWLARLRMTWWLTLPPALFMMVMTLWSLALNFRPYARLWRSGAPIPALTHVQFVITCTLLTLAAWLLVEAAACLKSVRAHLRNNQPL